MRSLVPAAALAAAILCASGATAGDPAPADNPLLLSSSYLGGSGDEIPTAAAVGPDGALWIAASSSSSNIPGAVRVPGTASWFDALVLRLDPVTRDVLSAAWLSGSAGSTGSPYDVATALAFDGAGNAYVAGSTRSSAFPATSRFGPPRALTDGADAFVARLAKDGSGFVWVALLGGSGVDWANGLCVTPDGDPVVVGVTNSKDFPLLGPLRPTLGGEKDLFVTRIRADGSAIVSSTFLGGNGFEDGGVIAALPGGGFLVSGVTDSIELTTRGPVFGNSSARPATFLAEIDAAGAVLRRAAFLGPTSVSAISVEASGTLLLAAEAHEVDPRVPAAPRGNADDGGADALLLRLDATTWEVLGGVSFGGSGDETEVAMATGPDGTVWLTGSTRSPDLPVPGAIRVRSAGDADAFVAAFAPSDLALTFATYLGGSDLERSERVAVGADGSAWVVGSTQSEDFLLRDPVRGRDSESEFFVTHLRRGDAAARPGVPESFAVEALGATSVRLGWTIGAGGTETGFVIDRAEFQSFTRVASVPAGTTQWTDTSVLPDRGYTYSVQAVNEDGGSPPTQALRVLTPGSLEVRIDKGRIRSDASGDRRSFRLEGSIARGAGVAGPPDLRAAGVRLDVFTAVGPAQLVGVDPGDPRWRGPRRRLRWQSANTRLDFDAVSGRFELRVRGWMPQAAPGESLAIRIECGPDAATISTQWDTVFRHGLGTP